MKYNFFITYKNLNIDIITFGENEKKIQFNTVIQFV